MARSKNLHQVTVGIPLIQPNNTTDSPIEGQGAGSFTSASQIDLSLELSKVLGRTIKQGQNFRVVGWGTALVPRASGIELDPENGMGVTSRFAYIPTTKFSTKAWRTLKDHYWKQAAFRKGLEGTARFDEFEVAWDTGAVTDRTSRVYVGGLTDPKPEACTLLGGYDDEDGLNEGHISAKYLLDAQHPVASSQALVEQDLLFDDTIHYKDAKFTSRFPAVQTISSSATFSSDRFYDHDILIDEIYQGGGVAFSETHWLPEGNHLDVLCGLLKPSFFVTTPDDENVLADGALLMVTFWIEGWSSIAKPLPSRKPRRRKSNRRKKR